MSERVSDITYNGKTIVYCDLANAEPKEIKATTDTVDRKIIAKGTNDQLFLVNISNCVIDNASMKVFKESAKKIQPYLKAGACFGLSGLKTILLNAINRFANTNMTAHKSMEEAKNALVAKAEA
jgi:hypothetical protein